MRAFRPFLQASKAVKRTPPLALGKFGRIAGRGAAPCALLFVGAGCYTNTRGEALEAQMRLNQERLDALERTLRTDLKEAKAKLAQLEEVLNRATQLVTRNSADVGAQVQTLEGRFASLEGQLAEDKNTIERLQSEVADQHTKLEGARKNPGEAVL